MRIVHNIGRMIRWGLLALCLLGIVSCRREIPFEDVERLPDGTPVTISLNFGAGEAYDVDVMTKAEASRVDEHNVHDLYVFIFKEDGTRLYGRYFTFEHLSSSITNLNTQKNEGWWVRNITVEDVNKDKDKTLAEKMKTRGAVKISTEAQPNCKLVVLANLENTVFSLDGQDALHRLGEIETLDQLKAVKVALQQDVVSRANQFLMMGELDVENTSYLTWGSVKNNNPVYNSNYTVDLGKIDAKVKFRIKYNTTNISKIEARNWEAHRVPENCLLYPNEAPENGDAHDYFDALPAYFEGTETENGETYHVFSFYMLENRQPPKRSVDTYEGNIFGTTKSKYFLREMQYKDDTSPHGDPYLQNRDPLDDGWQYAKQNATYVKFDLVLTLTPIGIGVMQEGIAEALTTEASFTVHLGNFTEGALGFDDYNVERGHFYTYNVTINNTESIYVEVRGKNGNIANRAETEPGQEGSLLLTTQGVINCDAHYEYHQLTFNYSAALGHEETPGSYDNRKKYSWHIKTPFFDDSAMPTRDFNTTTGFYDMDLLTDRVGKKPDYQWVKFAVNEMGEDDVYKVERTRYPGYDPDSEDPDISTSYDATWNPDKAHPDVYPALMDINQLINFIFIQNEVEYEYRLDHSKPHSVFDKNGQLLVTAFVDEYYYERDPITGELDPDLWRQFVNAKPRELHILSDTEHSLDWRSDVIVSSHSIVQQSIQTIYNIYAPDLSSLWGAEHVDEMSYNTRTKYNPSAAIWPWWDKSRALPAGCVEYGDEENGRLNTAGIWGLTSGDERQWDTFMNYEVANNTPELNDYYFYQAYSCLTRNRDNNGNGVIDQEELRWYTAAINQLVGMWVGNEALSTGARLYQPLEVTNTTNDLLWRSETISSTCPVSGGGKTRGIKDPMIIRSEEGATKSWYSFLFRGLTEEVRDKVTSVRCVRNIGTYSDHGVRKDVSEAPYDFLFDQYYDFEKGQDPDGKAWPNDDGTYTIRFTRLNAKSIREYTSGDLPFHSEYSMNNCVYLRVTAQNPLDAVWADGTINKDVKALNNAITIHNDYCPLGYRMPNMTELLMLSALLPKYYWRKDGDPGNAYISEFPCRTYWTRGSLGDELKTSSETSMTAWSYMANEDRVHLKGTGNTTSIRCVRDDNMIGDITGQLTVEDNEYRRLSEDWNLDLNFFSLSSVIRSVQLKICYTDASGNKRELELPSSGIPLGGSTIRQTVTIPKEVLIGNIPVTGFMTVRAEVRNAAGITRFFDAPVRLVSELYTSLKLLPSEYNPAETNVTFPVLITASHAQRGGDPERDEVEKWVLRVTGPDKRITYVDLTSSLPSGHPTYATLIYNYEPANLRTGTYSFQLEAHCDGQITRSEEVSMEVLKANYDPLASVDVAGVTKSYQIDDEQYKWKREMIQGLDFARGDFIETDMDISRCIYRPVYAKKIDDNWVELEMGDDGFGDPEYINGRLSVGLDDLISFGVTDTNWTDYSFHVYYPAIPNLTILSETRLAFDPVWDSTDDDFGYEGCNYTNLDYTKPLHIRLDEQGIYWNNHLMEVSQFTDTNREKVQDVLNRLINARTLYVGSTEGHHRSRAIYRFVRVVYNGDYSTTRGDSSYFENDPIFGGNL